MPLFSADVLASLRAEHRPDRWPGVLAADGAEGLREAVEHAVAALPEAVRTPVGRWIREPGLRTRHLARAVLWAHGVAAQDGFLAEDLLDSGALIGRAGDGAPVVLAPLLFHVDEAVLGINPAAMRLRDRLGGVLGERPFAVRLRRPVAEDVDLASVVSAVQLWLGSVDRGEWQGRHAVYEDDGIHIELSLLDMPRGAGRSLWVPPGDPLRQLAIVDSHLQAMLRHLQKTHAEAAVIAVLAGSPRWALPRGYPCQVLYGTPIEVVAAPDQPAQVDYDAREPNLLADPLLRRLAALWWLEPAPGPLGVTGLAHDNPWYDGPSVPAFPGRRYAAVAGAPPGRKRMSWQHASDTLAWSAGG